VFSFVREANKERRMLEKPIQMRYAEREAFPGALSDLQQAHWATRMFLQSAADNATEDAANDLPPKYTPEEIEVITKQLKDSETWLSEGVTKQKEIKRCGDADPVLLSAELKARGTALQRDVMKLLKRKAPRKKPAAFASSSESSTIEDTTSSSTFAESTTKSTITKTSGSAQPTHSRDEL
jgi:hypoxia up-regulated 1